MASNHSKTGSTMRQDVHKKPADVQAWADEAAAAVIAAVHVSSPPNVRGTSVRLSIPLDAPASRRVGDDLDSAISDSDGGEPAAAARPKRKPMRRDSLDRREALQKGREGSRQRRRWENDRLLNNPWAQPPLPSDWEVHPTHPKRVVPYFLAPLWDAKLAARREEEFRQRRAASRARKANDGAVGGEAAERVPKELRARLKRSKAARPLLRELEEDVRHFVEGWERRTARLAERGLDDIGSEAEDDDELVFVGRNGEMHDLPPSPRSTHTGRRRSSASTAAPDSTAKEKLVFDSPVDDHGASFGRWLVHSIAAYYGLRTWSVTTGHPARREAYVGIQQLRPQKRVDTPTQLPTPLWGMV